MYKYPRDLAPTAPTPRVQAMSDRNIFTTAFECSFPNIYNNTNLCRCFSVSLLLHFNIIYTYIFIPARPRSSGAANARTSYEGWMNGWMSEW